MKKQFLLFICFVCGVISAYMGISMYDKLNETGDMQYAVATVWFAIYWFFYSVSAGIVSAMDSDVF